jgi:S1-C subfamily serine protease
VKYLAALLALLSFGCGCGSAPPPEPLALPVAQSPAAIVEGIRGATVAIIQGGDIYCSGVWVGPSEVLTAAHCVAAEGPTYIALYEQIGAEVGSDQVHPVGFQAFLSRKDDKQDLALLSVVPILFPHGVAELSPMQPVAMDLVYIVGHTAGLPFSFTPGFVDGVRHMIVPELQMEGDYLQVWAGVWGGNSGGGLWDPSGRLLGICNFGIRGSIHHFSAPSAIQAFLNG